MGKVPPISAKTLLAVLLVWLIKLSIRKVTVPDGEPEAAIFVAERSTGEAGQKKVEPEQIGSGLGAGGVKKYPLEPVSRKLLYVRPLNWVEN